MTTRDVDEGEELYIFYGHKLWFESAESRAKPENIREMAEDEWGGLLVVDPASHPTRTDGPFLDGDPDEIIPEEELPFSRFKLPPEEEELDTIRTGLFPRYPPRLV